MDGVEAFLKIREILPYRTKRKASEMLEADLTAGERLKTK